MVLLGYSWIDILLGVLYVSLGLLVIVILYRKLIAHLGKGEPIKEDYCVLYSLESEPTSGEAEFYFTSDSVKNYKLIILDGEMNELKIVKEDKCTVGGNIIRFDTTQLTNGQYFYSLVTDNQKTSKKMTVQNG